MKSKMVPCVAILVGALVVGNGYAASLLAFPEAEGYGKYVTGGRGGAVYEVTNLNASGAGSFGAAIGAKGARTIVFRVSGTIPGDYKISNGDLTIAGQTAPGDGITIKGSLTTGASNLIIRYIRVRPSPDGETDAIGGRYQKDIIFDHISASWSSDEVMSLYHNENVTIQWCIASEGCAKFINGVNTGHRFGGIWGNRNGTYHHNLISNNDSRNIRWASGSDYNDYRNNVIYNWGYQSCYGGGAVQNGVAGWTFTTVNMVNNYYKPGPATQTRKRIAEPSNDGGVGSFYVSGNIMEGASDVNADNWKGFDGSNFKKLSSPWAAMAINEESAADAFKSVIAKAGCSLRRDAVDTRITKDAAAGTFTYGAKGIITRPEDVGGWPELKSEPAPADGDHDGMPDAWEKSHGLNAADAKDGNGIGAGGYTNLEIYLNSLTGAPPTGIQAAAPHIGSALTASHDLATNRIEFSLPENSRVRLDLVDLSGRSAAVLMDESKTAGSHAVGLDGKNLKKGMYVYRLSAAGKTLSGKLILNQ